MAGSAQVSQYNVAYSRVQSLISGYIRIEIENKYKLYTITPRDIIDFIQCQYNVFQISGNGKRFRYLQYTDTCCSYLRTLVCVINEAYFNQQTVKISVMEFGILYHLFYDHTINGINIYFNDSNVMQTKWLQITNKTGIIWTKRITIDTLMIIMNNNEIYKIYKHRSIFIKCEFQTKDSEPISFKIAEIHPFVEQSVFVLTTCGQIYLFSLNIYNYTSNNHEHYTLDERMVSKAHFIKMTDVCIREVYYPKFAVLLDNTGCIWKLNKKVSAVIIEKISLNEAFIVDITSCESAVGSHCLALDKEGNVYSFGHSRCGALGTGKLLHWVMEPQKVSIVDDDGNYVRICKIFAGEETSFALSVDNQLYGWGHNQDHKLLKKRNAWYTHPTLIRKTNIASEHKYIVDVICGSSNTLIVTSV